MAKVVVGMFDDIQDAQRAVEELVENGFDRKDLSMIARDVEGKYRDRLERTGKEAGKSAAEGAGIGAIVGGLGGLLLSLTGLAIPGIGPVLAAGPLVAALAGAGVGAAAGGVIGALSGAGVPEEQAHMYAEGVRRGGTLVTVTTTDERTSLAADILNRHRPFDVNQRAESWRQENWTGFDESAEPYTAEQIQIQRSSTPVPYGSDVEETREKSQRGHQDLERDLEDREASRFDVVEEEMRVGDQESQTGGVRVYPYRSDKPVEETVDLRKDVEVERVDREDYDEYDAVFRNHFDSTYTRTGGAYEAFVPAYQYGYTLAHDARFRGRDWPEIEPEARREWGRQHAEDESSWDQVRDAVRHAWVEVTNRRFMV